MKVILHVIHITCHSYTKLGLLALDVFTCGKTNPEIVADYIKKELEVKYPYIKCVNYETHKRFLEYDE